MSKYRTRLPQLSDKLFLTDGGLETTLIFHQGVDLPDFAAFTLLKSDAGEKVLADYYSCYAEVATKSGSGLILETPTWRASRDWGARLGHDEASLNELNRTSVRQLQTIRDRFETEQTPIVISGSLGPRGDGYQAEQKLSVSQAEDYHAAQIQSFSGTRSDLVTALTMTHPEEAIGISHAARTAKIPVVLSFTVEVDGHLPTGQSLREAIESVDTATESYPAYYGINCAHPTHFSEMLAAADPAPWLSRIRAVRANASRKSHAELDEATELDDGNPKEFGIQSLALRQQLPNLNVLGGCCGTDHRHIEAVAQANSDPRGEC